MKKLFSIVMVSLLFSVFAQESNERKLFDASALAETKWESQKVSVSNAAENWTIEVIGAAKYSAKKASFTKPTKDGMIGIKIEMSDDIFEGKPIYFVVKPGIYPQLTETDSGNGRLTNIADIRSVRITGITLGYEVEIIPEVFRYNRYKEEVDIPCGKFKSNEGIVGKQAFDISWNNPEYIADPTKREIKVKPVYPNNNSEIFLRGIGIRAPVNNRFVIIYLDKIFVSADKAYETENTDDEELWGLETKNKEWFVKKQEKEIENKKLINEKEKALMGNLE
jgi:hypothetical protein